MIEMVMYTDTGYFSNTGNVIGIPLSILTFPTVSLTGQDNSKEWEKSPLFPKGITTWEEGRGSKESWGMTY